MPTFTPLVLMHHLKDGKAKLKIRIQHNYKTRYLDSGLTVSLEDLDIPKRGKKKSTANLKIGSSFAVETTKRIDKFKKLCDDHSQIVPNMDIDQLIQFIQREPEGPLNIDFFQFAEDEIQRLKDQGSTGTARNRRTAVNALERYILSQHKPLRLPVQDLTAQFLKDFANWLEKNPKAARVGNTMTRAVSLYMVQIRALHNSMKAYYNDDDLGVIRIPYSPFKKYKIPKERPPVQRALSVDSIRTIFQLQHKKEAVRYNLALDCFKLSFLLIGMNSADLYECPPVKGGRITYKRVKTRTRRQDEALISIQVPEEAKEIIGRYSDSERAFNFHRHYSSPENFNKALAKGLGQVAKAAGLPDFTFYAARHSWASVAANECHIDKFTVHECLNHSSTEMRVTDLYIRRDWRKIDNANQTVISFTLNSKHNEN